MPYSMWGQDLDAMSVAWPRGDRYSRHLTSKGRCKRCWGALTARGDSERGCSAIRCRVCGAEVRGSAAGEEWERMEAERALNLLRMDHGTIPSESAGDFTFKVFPDVGRLSTAEVESRIAERQRRDKREWITRDEFLVGSAGWLVFQATTLLAGIDHEALWDVESLAGFTEFETGEDGPLFVPDGPGWDADGSQSKESRVQRWMGLIMTATLHSAFACELVLKAILLTCRDEAKKTHDLIKLLKALPANSRSRVLADYPEMASLLDRQRLTFGAWRYFDRNVGSGGIQALIDTAAARDLGRAARVLLDEAEVVGLRAGFEFEGTRNLEETGSGRLHREHFSITLTSGESPPAV